MRIKSRTYFCAGHNWISGPALIWTPQSVSLDSGNCRQCLWSPQLKLLSPYNTEVPSRYLLSLLDKKEENTNRQSSEHLLSPQMQKQKLTTLSTISFALLFFNWSIVDYNISGIHQSDSVHICFSDFCPLWVIIRYWYWI